MSLDANTQHGNAALGGGQPVTALPESSFKWQHWYRHPKAMPGALLALFVVFALLTAGMIQSLTNSAIERVQVQREQTVLNATNVLQHDLSNYLAVISGVGSEARFLAQVANPTEAHLEAIAYSFEQVAKRMANFDKIRWLDAAGRERVRVELQPNGQIARTPAGELQSKASRPFFKDNIDLAPNHISVSDLDLLMENGELFRPLRKVWRVGISLRSATGESLGILLINLDTKDLLKQLPVTQDGQTAVAVLNAQGEWIHNPEQPEKEFGLQLGTNITFAKERPTEWQAIQESPSGSVHATDRIWFWHRYDPRREAYKDYTVIGPPLVLLGYIDKTLIRALTWKSAIVVVPIMLAVFAVLTWVLMNLFRSLNALNQQQRRVNSIIEGAQTGTWELDLQSRKSLLNDHFIHMLGYTRSELAPFGLGQLKPLMHPDDVRKFTLDFEAHKGHPKTIFKAKFRMRHKDGHWVWIQSRGQIIQFSPEGKPLLMYGTHTDISDLVNAIEKADAANQAKSQFLASMSHELRTPMNAILGFTQVLERDSLTEDQMECMQEVSKAGKLLMTLIDEVLDLSKIESGNVQLSTEALDAGELVEECLALMKPQAQSRNIALDFHAPKGMWVLADRMRLRQVLLNLLSNAVKYNRPSGTVSVSLFTGAHQTRFTVTDTGQGIPQEAQALIFQPFQRGVAENSGIPGTGIGLNISRQLVQLMHGEIGFESTWGQGSVFWLAMPVASGLGPPAVHQSTPDVETAIREARTPPKTVLCVDDNPANLRLVIKMLKARAHVHVLSANAPELAIELASAHRPNLILLDINMPRMDGFEVLKILRQRPELDLTPVVALTANAMPKDVARGKAAGFEEYLTKPLNLASFLDTVDICLNKAP
jgi:PAS domain S-box-containing protein